ncbi:universal stress protein [Sphaerisporangium siamense]|uniref:Nucleotide-binding universal stress UspA family protein n=1 Tax=Sphaerisporangium siamense TaxID=795645 RepID=A0A7W7GCD5_9ACTN|nr:universal stress protein [Sphaerisporangium siamense]MBB4703765.1 nucleotide-binding universal stress UspA family protein [Sphaerisporangium siamense]GII82233.1 universal stress protein [Sphaerisporangium siamense]
MSGTIVVGVDGSSPATAAVEWAARDAARLNAAVKIVHVREPWSDTAPFHSIPGFQDSLSEFCEGVVAAAAERVRAYSPDIEVSTVLAAGTVVDTLMREARDADEVVLGSRGMGGFTGLVLGSVGLGVAGHFPGPVVIVRGSAETKTGEVVVGYDGSPASEAAMDYAFAQAEARSARLRVVHAWQSPLFSSFAVAYTDVVSDLYENHAEEFQRGLEPWLRKYPGVSAVGSSVFGAAVPALAEASRHADLVVVGSRGLGGFGSAVLGSVSHGVLHHSHCPVAIVRPHGEG